MTDQDVLECLTEGAALHRQRRFEEAIALYDRVLAERPGNLDARIFLASAYRSGGRLEQAVEIYDAVAAEDPQRADFWFNRGNALSDVDRRDEALASYDRALQLEPDNAAIHANRAICLAACGRPLEAIDAYRCALEIDPDHRISLNNGANLLAEQNRLQEAASYLRRSIRNWPDQPEGHYNLSHLLLRLGDFANGFSEYEWRWQTQDFTARPDYRGVQEWRGEPLHGKRLIVHAEQGLGDSIQFAKLLGMAKSLGGDIVFHVPEKLERLMKTLPFDITITSALKAGEGDYQISLMSLPHRLKLTAGSIPLGNSYLSPESDEVRKWRDRLQLDQGTPTMGFVWQGNPNSPAERGRSLPSPEILAPFAGLHGVRLIALQMLPEEMLEAADNRSGWRVAGLSFELEHPGPDMDRGPDAFIDTAAILAGLDLFASVCTAPLHLAGALGRPTLALLKAVPDWRWMMECDDTAWYPSMRLMRQAFGEDYRPVIDRAVSAARRLITSGSF